MQHCIVIIRQQIPYHNPQEDKKQTLGLLLLPNNHSWEGRSGHRSSLHCTEEAARRQPKNHRTEHLHMVVGKMRSSDLLAVLED